MQHRLHTTASYHLHAFSQKLVWAGKYLKKSWPFELSEQSFFNFFSQNMLASFADDTVIDPKRLKIYFDYQRENDQTVVSSLEYCPLLVS
jgi:hypothetical protein